MRNRNVLPLAGAALLLGSGLAMAQTQTQPAAKPATPPAATTPDSATKMDNTTAMKTDKVTLTEAQAKAWIDKPIYSSDNKEIGEVVDFKRSADNNVLEMHADIGGLLGLGETRVKLTPEQFKLQNDRVMLNMTEAQAKNLPKVEN